MINSSEQVFEVDCDLDTLVCWLQNNPDWAEKIGQTWPKRNLLYKILSGVKKLFFPAQMIMSSPNSFRVKGWVNFLMPVVFSIVEGEKTIKIKAGEMENNVKGIGFISRSNPIRSSIILNKFRWNWARKMRIQKNSRRYLHAFGDYVNRAGLPSARR